MVSKCLNKLEDIVLLSDVLGVCGEIKNISFVADVEATALDGSGILDQYGLWSICSA